MLFVTILTACRKVGDPSPVVQTKQITNEDLRSEFMLLRQKIYQSPDFQAKNDSFQGIYSELLYGPQTIDSATVVWNLREPEYLQFEYWRDTSLLVSWVYDQGGYMNQGTRLSIINLMTEVEEMIDN